MWFFGVFVYFFAFASSLPCWWVVVICADRETVTQTASCVCLGIFNLLLFFLFSALAICDLWLVGGDSHHQVVDGPCPLLLLLLMCPIALREDSTICHLDNATTVMKM
jgi:hypothetical protein